MGKWKNGKMEKWKKKLSKPRADLWDSELESVAPDVADYHLRANAEREGYHNM